jgi:hypothetical protein
MPRFLSIVKFSDPQCQESKMFDFAENERFIYFGLIAQDNTRCIVQSLSSGRIMPYLVSTIFEEVDPVDF